MTEREAMEFDVVVVGAGPAGLVTALELARHGVASTVLESELQVSLGSRAIVFTRRTLEILQQVGVADRMTAAGLPWRCGNSHYRGQRVFRMEAPHDADDRFFPMINLQQQYLEQYLTEAVLAHPLIDMRWGNRVTRVDHNDGFARIEVDTPGGPYLLECDWLVAADGAILHYANGYSDLKDASADTAPSPLYAIWGTSPSDFYVVGDRGLIQHRE